MKIIKSLFAQNIWPFILFALVSCSTTNQKTNKKIKTQSSSTPAKYSEQLKPSLFIYNSTPDKTIVKPKLVTPKSFELLPSNKLNKNTQEQLQEINQNLALYCIKHRSDSKFNSEENCFNFTKIIFNKCELKYKKINTALVNCIKKSTK